MYHVNFWLEVSILAFFSALSVAACWAADRLKAKITAGTVIKARRLNEKSVKRIAQNG